jgi:hypothetical protein
MPNTKAAGYDIHKNDGKPNVCGNDDFMIVMSINLMDIKQLRTVLRGRADEITAHVWFNITSRRR